MPALSIERIEVRERDLEALVRVTDLALVRTSAIPGIAEKASALLPGLTRHSCENDASHDFLRELRDTETPHLLEHVSCELMALAGSPRSLRGRTEWDFAKDGKGVFRVRLEFDDDIVALGALRGAADIVEWLLGDGGQVPDVDVIVQRLESRRGG